MVNQALNVEHKEIENFCRRWDVVELAVFGSALREDFRSESDIDILITFRETSHRGFFDIIRMQAELSVLFGRDVDLVEKEAVEKSENYIRRGHILQSEEPVYVAG